MDILLFVRSVIASGRAFNDEFGAFVKVPVDHMHFRALGSPNEWALSLRDTYTAVINMATLGDPPTYTPATRTVYPDSVTAIIQCVPAVQSADFASRVSSQCH